MKSQEVLGTDEGNTIIKKRLNKRSKEGKKDSISWTDDDGF